MAKLTVREVLRRLDSILPSTAPREDKLRWITQAEHTVLREIFGAADPLPPLGMEGELSVPSPYEDLYQHYAEAQIYYRSGEFDRYNCAAGLWNSLFTAYKDYVNRNGKGKQGVTALKLC